MSPVTDDQAAGWLRAYPNFRQADLENSDNATAQTVGYMVELVQHSLGDPIIARAWQDAWQRFHAIAFGDEAICCWWYARYLIKFVHHQVLLREWLLKFDELQLLISPEALLKMQSPKGDCAVFTTLICAMLSYRGMPWEIVTAGVDLRRPDLFTHVWPQVIRPDGSRLALDASHGKVPGWHAPESRISKKKSGGWMGTKSQEVMAWA